LSHRGNSSQSTQPILPALNRLIKREYELVHREDEQVLWNGEPAIRLRGAGDDNPAD
jgi:hypothetical protein